MMIRLQFIILLVLFCNGIHAAEIKYSVNTIPDSLYDNAKVIVRTDETVFEISAINKAQKSIKFAITILNKNGDSFGIFSGFYNRLQEISNMKICIYDRNGELIKKVKNSDIEDYSAASGYALFEDIRVKYYKPLINDYPYTIEYEYEINYKGLLNYPVWQPLHAYNYSVEKSSFQVITPNYLAFRFKESNIPKPPEITETENEITYCWSVHQLKSLQEEPNSPNLYEYSPVLYTAPKDFEIEGYTGNMESWENFGEWIRDLNTGLDELPDNAKVFLIQLVENETSEIEKIKKVYEYFQEKTRYVSIQVGIGSWRPFSAQTVHEFGYGDCKALSNYMKALLKSIGIGSFYTLVKAGNDRSILSDFPSNQFNHVILCVPLEQDTIWLECTNQTIPFGYLGNFTDDRDVLLITAKGGVMAHTQVYCQTNNTQFRKAMIELDTEGNASANINTIYSGLQYDNVRDLLLKEEEDQRMLLIKSNPIPNASIEDHSISATKSRIPSATLTEQITISKYAPMVGTRMFVPLNILNKTEYIPELLENRECEIKLNFAFHDADTIIYKIPFGFKVENWPELVKSHTIFGIFEAQAIIEGENIVYTRTRKMNKGTFPPENYNEFIEFYRQISNSDKMKLVLVKE